MTAIIDPAVAAEFNNIRVRHKAKHRWAIFKMDDRTIVMDTTGERKDGYQDLLSSLPSTHPRFALYDYEFKTRDGRMSDKLYFIHWSPVNSNQEDNIRYTQSMPSFRQTLPGTDHFATRDKKELANLLKTEFNPNNPDAGKDDDDDDSESDMSD